MELKHVCKFCKKSFPSGRSLGGHIRSHLIHNNNNSIQTPKPEPELPKPGSTGPGYELRENPKKTNKATDLLNSCPSSWSTESEIKEFRRSNFVGNNSNSSASEVVEMEQEEVAIAMCLIMLSKDVGSKVDISCSINAEFSDNISMIQGNNSRKRRRGKTQEKNSEFGGNGINNNNNTSKNSKKLESRAYGHSQNGSKMKEFEVYANGFATNGQNNKAHEGKKCRMKIQGKASVSVAIDHNNTSKKSKKVESLASGKLQSESKLKEVEVLENGFVSNDQYNKKKVELKASGFVKNGSKLKQIEVLENGFASNDEINKPHDHESGVDHKNGLNTEFSNDNNDKRSKFECTTCNKVFHSYQALGGHRASHKKLLGIKCSSISKLQLEKDIINGQDFPSPPDDDDHDHQQQVILPEIMIGLSSSSSSKKLVQKHECPICFRVFPSGQALGGHKRSHLFAANNNNNSNNDSNSEGKSSQISKSPEIRDLLDLNLPLAPVEEDTTTTTVTTSSSHSLVGFIKPHWWVESSHKHEPLLGLISN